MASDRIKRYRDDIEHYQDIDIDSCDVCHSRNIQKTPEGYVCGECGIVLSRLIMEYHRPYTESRIHHAPKGRTQIGTVKERFCNEKSLRLDKLSKLDSERNADERAKINGIFEIKKILSNLGLSLGEVDPVLKLFLKLRKCLQKGTKYRSVRKLVPITIYLYFKLNFKGINEQELLEKSEISKKEFNSFKLQLRDYIPQYYSRDRKHYILQKIMNITVALNQDMQFYHAAEKVLEKFWQIIKNTKDDVVAGVCTSIIALCEAERDLKVSTICNQVGIQMSTIHRQIEQKIFERFRVEGFESLVRSSDLLRKLMVKIGIIEDNVALDPQPISILKIKIGNATNVFNAHESMEYYIYAVKTTFGSFILTEEDVHSEKFLIEDKDINPDGVNGRNKFSIELSNFRYPYPKGPPELTAIL
jgi:transcription initiation factor TFIIIB Brf1 subunit/transcription initiation factor TFIIB